MRIPTLSMWQPWASLLVHGKKRIETRSWAYRGRLPAVLAIHAAKKWERSLRDLCFTEYFDQALFDIGVLGSLICPCEPELPFGAVVGLVRVAEVCDTVGLASRHGSYPPRADETEQAFGDYGPGRFGWVCDRFHALQEPIPLKGQQGIWHWLAPLEVALVAEAMAQGGDDGGPTGSVPDVQAAVQPHGPPPDLLPLQEADQEPPQVPD